MPGPPRLEFHRRRQRLGIRGGRAYFKEIFDYARTLDPQHRPLTYTNLMMAAAGKDKCINSRMSSA